MTATLKNQHMNALTFEQACEVRAGLIAAQVALEMDMILLGATSPFIPNRTRQLAAVNKAFEIMTDIPYIPHKAEEIIQSHALLTHTRAKADLFAE
jgi:hypothetical protein